MDDIDACIPVPPAPGSSRVSLAEGGEHVYVLETVGSEFYPAVVLDSDARRLEPGTGVGGL
ncbi:hypothetical protein ACFVZR_38480 [Streptomyces sp. NPDC058316]|uniref:hypothetical protein n=1 Tax=unclassified Streptomyces TaxID=2593676 RepID=UPI003330683F